MTRSPSPLPQTCSDFIFAWFNLIFQIAMGFFFGFAVTAVSYVAALLLISCSVVAFFTMAT